MPRAGPVSASEEEEDERRPLSSRGAGRGARSESKSESEPEPDSQAESQAEIDWPEAREDARELTASLVAVARRRGRGARQVVAPRDVLAVDPDLGADREHDSDADSAWDSDADSDTDSEFGYRAWPPRGRCYWELEDASARRAVPCSRRAQDWAKYYAYRALDNAWFAGEVLLHFFGLDRSRYQWALDEVERRRMREEMEAVRRLTGRWPDPVPEFA